MANEVVGSVTADITGNKTESGESALGDLIADAQLYASSRCKGAAVALMNPGGIRDDILFNQTSDEKRPGEVIYEEAFDVQPFGNNLIVMNLTGKQIDSILEEQFDNPSPGQNRILQVSRGFTYAWNESAPTGSKVDIADIKINGIPINTNGTYRVAANCFLAEGGDGFVTLKEEIERIFCISDTEALVDYLKAFSPVFPPTMDRISVVKEMS